MPGSSTLQEAAWLTRTLGRGDLSPFSQADMDSIAAVIGSVQAPAGTVLMVQGEPMRFIGLIREGRVELSTRRGARRVVLQVLHDGDVFGDIPFLCEMAPPFAARAITDVSVVRIEGQDLLRLIRSTPSICQRMMRILGELRVGGGQFQEATRRRVETLEMPGTAKVFLGLMALAMMTLLGSVVAHVIVGAGVAGDGIGLERAEQWAIWLEGVRRAGIATFLFAIAFGLATIVTAVRFQISRLRELPAEASRS
jgi:hypothetical protein